MVKEKAKATITALLCSGTIGIVMAYNGMAFWGLAVTANHLYFSALMQLLWYLFSVASYFFVQFQTYQGDASVQQ